MSLFHRSDLLRALSADSQARLTTDPNRPVRIGTGDGTTDTWDTPFLEASLLKGYVDGSVVTGTSLLRGTGAGGVDQILFPCAPAFGRFIAVSADPLAINKTVLDIAMEQAESIVEGYVRSGGWTWPVTGDALSILRPYFVGVVKWFLRDRRNLEDAKDDLPDWIKSWLNRLAEGKGFPVGTPTDTGSGTGSSDGLAYGSDEPITTGGWAL